jgi:hypothetical protein
MTIGWRPMVTLEVVARRLDLRFVPAVDPGALEDLLHLGVEDRGVGVDTAVDAVGFDQGLQVHAKVLS